MSLRTLSSSAINTTFILDKSMEDIDFLSDTQKHCGYAEQDTFDKETEHECKEVSFGYAEHNTFNEAIEDQDDQSLELSPIILSPQQKIKINNLIYLLNTLSLNISEEQCRVLSEKIIINLDKSNASFIKQTKKQSGAAFGFAIENKFIFLHEKIILGTGHQKITYAAKIIDLTQNLITSIVHQKVKKMSSKKSVLMTASEATLQKRLAHPNIVQVITSYSYGPSSDPKVAIYSERCDIDLESAVRKNTLILLEKKIIACDIAEALEFLHQQQFAHNDIKLDNIMLKNNRGKLTDFGLCFAFNSTEEFYVFKKTLPPEQKRKLYQTTSPYTDIYQYGLVLWHMFHPQPPSNHLEKEYVYPQIMFADWSSKSAFDSSIQDLIWACLSEDPLGRPKMEKIKVRLLKIE